MNLPITSDESIAYPEPGSVVWTQTHVFWRHLGIVSDRWHDGKPMVISASARAGIACEEAWDIFAGGKPVRSNVYPSSLPPREVICRARSMIGAPYRLFDFNCEHFVALAHGNEPRSPQLGATIFVIGLAGILFGATRRG